MGSCSSHRFGGGIEPVTAAQRSRPPRAVAGRSRAPKVVIGIPHRLQEACSKSAFFGDHGNFFALFHHTWCNSPHPRETL
jgi:hypothetical protein